MEYAEAEQEIEALKAIWPELQDRPPIWNSPSVAIPVYPLGAAGIVPFAPVNQVEFDRTVRIEKYLPRRNRCDPPLALSPRL